MDKRGRASRLYRVALHNSFPNFLILFLLVLGQEEVQEEGHDEADGVLEGTSGEKNSLGPVCPVLVTVRSILATIPSDRRRRAQNLNQAVGCAAHDELAVNTALCIRQTPANDEVAGRAPQRAEELRARAVVGRVVAPGCFSPSR